MQQIFEIHIVTGAPYTWQVWICVQATRHCFFFSIAPIFWQLNMGTGLHKGVHASRYRQIARPTFWHLFERRSLQPERERKVRCGHTGDLRRPISFSCIFAKGTISQIFEAVLRVDPRYKRFSD